MLQIQSFCFNPFQENTYVIWNNSNDCVIIDPGCSNEKENKELIAFIRGKKLSPMRLINTHCHLDHVLGNHLIEKEFNLLPEYHEQEKANLGMAKFASEMYGVAYHESSEATTFLTTGKMLIGEDILAILFTPGHSAGSVCLYCADQDFIIGGDVLFEGSIGRTDLPGGDHEQLLKSIKSELYCLPDQTTVFPGHGRPTTIGAEKKSNPFIRG